MSGHYIIIHNPPDATVRRIMRENDVAQSAIQLANSGYTTFTATRPSTRPALPRPNVLQGTGSRVAAPSPCTTRTRTVTTNRKVAPTTWDETLRLGQLSFFTNRHFSVKHCSIIPKPCGTKIRQFGVRQQSFRIGYSDRNLKAAISSWDEYKIAAFKDSMHKTKAASNLSSSNKPCENEIFPMKFRQSQSRL